MINALQEQLLKAGLATEDQAKKPKPPPRKKYSAKPKRKPAAKPRPKTRKPASDLEAAYRARSRAEKEEQQKKSRLAAQRKANRNKIKKLIATSALKLTEDGVLYQFVVGKNIKKI